MADKYCDCGDPFQIHDSNDPRCSKVRGVIQNHPTASAGASADPTQELLMFTRKVSSLAESLSGAMTGLGILTILGGLFIAFQSNSVDLGNGYVSTTHPYVQLGIIGAFAGLLEILIFRLIFNYIQMQARYREWQLNR